MLRKILYSKIVLLLLRSFCSIFYDSKYLTGKFFEEHRMGFWWAIRAIPRSFYKKRLSVRWPVGRNTNIIGGEKIHFDPSSINVFQQDGCYFQGFEMITIGADVWIGQNSGIITANHDLVNPDKHSGGKPVSLGDKTWIGMNSVILPGVTLGPHTIVGAGSIVTKSFPVGWCVIAGNPAKLIKLIEH